MRILPMCKKREESYWKVCYAVLQKRRYEKCLCGFVYIMEVSGVYNVWLQRFFKISSIVIITFMHKQTLIQSDLDSINI